MSNLLDHAERELELIGMGSNSEDMNKLMHDNLIQIIRIFSEQGHSGFSAGYAINVLEKLMRYEPLSDLTGEDNEWNDVSEMSGKPLWQNKRCGRVFKDGEGNAYDVEGLVFRDPDGDTYTSKESHMPVTFPYKPLTQYRDTNGKPSAGGHDAQSAHPSKLHESGDDNE